jgi:hypothetical protein
VAGDPFSLGLQLRLSIACGFIIANPYYAKPLTGPIGAELAMRPESIGPIVMLSLTGYGIGLLLVVRLGDLLENCRPAPHRASSAAHGPGV